MPTNPEARSSLRKIWVLNCPFTKTGFPVTGTFGRTIQPVVIMTMDTWKKLCADVPQLQTTQFEVGHIVGDDE